MRCVVDESPPLIIEAIVVRYYAVYPNGRRYEVDQQTALNNVKRWADEDDVQVVTKVERVPMCVIGTVERG